MVAHQLPRFSKSVLEKPQLLHKDKYLEISEILDNHAEYLSLREEASKLVNSGEDMSLSLTRFDNVVGSNVGVLEVDGPLTARSNIFQMLCGGTSYDQLVAQTEAYIQEGKDTLLLFVSSPGGEAFKMFSSAMKIQKLAKSAGMKIIAYVDGIAASAAYGLSVISDEIIAHPESHTIGSIGVIVSMLDDSKKLEKEGVRRVIVSAGKNKHPYDEDGAIKAEFLEDKQEDVDKLYQKFVTHVATNRNVLTEDVIRTTEAATYHAEDALNLGLIDKMMTEDELFDYLNIAEASANPHGGVINTTLETKTKEETLMSDTPKTEASVLDGVTAEMFAQLQSQLATYQAKEQAAEKASLVAKLEGVSFLSNHTEALTEFFMSADEGYKELMNTVIDSAQAENEKVVEEAASQIAEKEQELSAAQASVEEANAKVEEAQAEVLKTKEEFGKGDAIEGDVKDKTNPEAVSQGKARTAQLDAVVKAKLAANK